MNISTRNVLNILSLIDYLPDSDEHIEGVGNVERVAEGQTHQARGYSSSAIV